MLIVASYGFLYKYAKLHSIDSYLAYINVHSCSPISFCCNFVIQPVSPRTRNIAFCRKLVSYPWISPLLFDKNSITGYNVFISNFVHFCNESDHLMFFSLSSLSAIFLIFFTSIFELIIIVFSESLHRLFYAITPYFSFVSTHLLFKNSDKHPNFVSFLGQSPTFLCNIHLSICCLAHLSYYHLISHLFFATILLAFVYLKRQ